MKYQLLIVLLHGLLLGTSGAWAGATDISGTWTCTIDQKDDDGPMTVTFVLKQEGEKLTGAYSDVGHRDLPITGTVKGNKLEFSWEFKPPADSKKKGSLIVTFAGTIVSPTKITGTLPSGSSYCAAGCNWTATRKKK